MDGVVFKPPSYLDFPKHKTPLLSGFPGQKTPSHLDFQEKIEGLSLIYFS